MTRIGLGLNPHWALCVGGSHMMAVEKIEYEEDGVKVFFKEDGVTIRLFNFSKHVGKSHADFDLAPKILMHIEGEVIAFRRNTAHSTILLAWLKPVKP